MRPETVESEATYFPGMTMSPGELQRKVRQLDNDVGSIYEMLVGIQATQARHSNAFEVIVARLDEHDDRFDAVGRRLDSIDQRLTAIDDRLDSHDDRFDAIDGRLGRLEEGMTEVLTLLRAG